MKRIWCMLASLTKFRVMAGDAIFQSKLRLKVAYRGGWRMLLAGVLVQVGGALLDVADRLILNDVSGRQSDGN